jgi:hypothetical protein
MKSPTVGLQSLGGGQRAPLPGSLQGVGRVCLPHGHVLLSLHREGRMKDHLEGDWGADCVGAVENTVSGLGDGCGRTISGA